MGKKRKHADPEVTEPQDEEDVAAEPTSHHKKKKKKKRKHEDRDDLEVNGVDDAHEVGEEIECEQASKSLKKKKKKSKREKRPTSDNECEVMENGDVSEIKEENEDEENDVVKKKSKKKKKKKDQDISTPDEEENSNHHKRKKKLKHKDRPDDCADAAMVDETSPVKKKKKKKSKADTDPCDETAQPQEAGDSSSSGSEKTDGKSLNGAAPSNTQSAGLGQWATADLADTDRQNKFMRLLGGMKGTNKGVFSKTPPTSKGKANMALDRSREQELLTTLTNQFEDARKLRTSGQLGTGIGFKLPEGHGKKFHIDSSKTKSMKFE